MPDQNQSASDEGREDARSAKTPEPTKREEREKRLVAALRENLRRRKAAAKPGQS